VAAAVVVALVAATLGVTAVIRLPARGTSCDAITAAADTVPSLVAIGAAEAPPTATGTVIRGNGVILTALAALPGGAASGVSVTLSDGEHEGASVVGTDAATGLAVLKVDRQQLPFVLLSPREPVHAGLPVVALGSPHLASSGILAGTVQSVATDIAVPGSGWTLGNAIATDLARADGNLGAPVVTCDNRLIGVVVGWAPDSSAAVVPAESVQRVVTRLLGLG
jgi:S1-C subfamily serine protease